MEWSQRGVHNIVYKICCKDNKKIVTEFTGSVYFLAQLNKVMLDGH